MNKLKHINGLKAVEYINITIYILLLISGVLGHLYLRTYFQQTVEHSVTEQVDFMVMDVAKRNTDIENATVIHPGVYPSGYTFIIKAKDKSDILFSTYDLPDLINDTRVQDYFIASERISNNKGVSHSIVTTYKYNGDKYILYVAPLLDGSFYLEGAVPFKVEGAWTYKLFAFYNIFILVFSTFALMNILHIHNVNKKLKTDVESMKAAEVAEQANKAKSDFLANMSHEIRTPINSVLGLNEMIIRESTETDIIKYAEDIKSAGESLLSLINDILDFSKIEAGKMELFENDYETAELFTDLNNMTKVRAHAKNLEFIVSIDKHIPSMLNGDRLRVQQILTNLLSNAVKYTDEGSVTLRASWDDEMQSLRVSVIDTGRGIAEEDVKLMFEKFQRINLKDNNNIEGTGLGLTITKQLIDKMHGTLTIKSEFGSGSTFTVLIPQKKIGTAEIGIYDVNTRKKSTEYKELFTAPTANILVVDDTKMNLTVIQKLLKKTEINVSVIDNGEDAINLITDNDYDLVLLDIRMPYMGGEEVLYSLRKKHIKDDLPIIALTADALPESKSKYISEGFADYLAKPVKPSDLEKLIIEYLPKDKVHLVTEEDIKPQELNAEMKKQLLTHLFEYVQTKNLLAIRGMLDTLLRQEFPEDFVLLLHRLDSYFKNDDLDAMSVLLSESLKD